MKKTPLIAAAALIAVASTAVIATAHDRGDGPRNGRGGPEALMERFDTNGDGQITMEEIQAAAVARFAEADANDDGQLSAEEMSAAADAQREERRAERQAERIAKRIEKADTNGDGVLNLEEAVAAGSDRIERLFDRLDDDEDGVITQAELEDAKGRFGRGRHGKRGGHSDNN